MRREFDLPAEDVTFLDREVASWEAIRSGNMMWILIYDYEIPDQYVQGKVTMAINISGNYPVEKLDMVYFSPSISRRDGKIIPQTQHTVLVDGTPYQRWSRHYTAQNPWKSGEHSIETHYYLIANWLEREFERRP